MADIGIIYTEKGSDVLASGSYSPDIKSTSVFWVMSMNLKKLIEKVTKDPL